MKKTDINELTMLHLKCYIEKELPYKLLENTSAYKHINVSLVQNLADFLTMACLYMGIDYNLVILFKIFF